MQARLLLVCFLISITATAQVEEDGGYSFLSRTFLQVNLGYINYDFGNELLNDGFTAAGTRANPFSGRLLLGYKFNEQWALQHGVMRPASWFQYDKVNGTNLSKSVFINAWFLTLSRNFKIKDRWSLFAEAGPVRVTRKGFFLGENRGVEDHDYFSLLAVGGLKYKLNEQWELTGQASFIPQDTNNQPAITQFTAGIQYNLSNLVPKEYHETSAVFFPKHTLQIGYSNDAVGFAANKFFSLQARIGNFRSAGIPVFWYGDVKASNTISLNYARTVYKGKKIFTLGYGASLVAFQSSVEREWIYGVSVYPQMNFYFWRNDSFNMYGTYSVIGPTYLSKEDIDGLETGPKITYQDFMGVGAYFGTDNSINAEVKIIHYSNGNWFNKNAGVAVPLVFSMGYSF
jgi:hypothetical protein